MRAERNGNAVEAYGSGRLLDLVPMLSALEPGYGGEFSGIVRGDCFNSSLSGLICAEQRRSKFSRSRRCRRSALVNCSTSFYLFYRYCFFFVSNFMAWYQ